MLRLVSVLYKSKTLINSNPPLYQHTTPRGRAKQSLKDKLPSKPAISTGICSACIIICIVATQTSINLNSLWDILQHTRETTTRALEKSPSHTCCPWSPICPSSYMLPADGPLFSLPLPVTREKEIVLVFNFLLWNIYKSIENGMINQTQEYQFFPNLKTGSEIPPPSNCLHRHSWQSRALSTSQCPITPLSIICISLTLP